MLRRTIEIVASSFLMAIQELWKNKLRTFLSLLGVTFGIFCIISVLATVNSLEQNIQNEVKSLGTNTIYIDKWDYSGGPNYPWWKFVNRPSPRYEDMVGIKPRTPSAKFVAFKISAQDKIEYQGNQLSNIILHGVSEEFSEIQPVDIAYGRYLSESEFQSGSPVAVIGYQVADEFFGSQEAALGKLIQTRGKKFTVAGVIKKQGNTIIGGWQFDQCMITSYRMARNIMDGRRADPVIMVQGQDYVSSKQLKDDLMSTMRGLRKLSPTQEDNFSLNDINDFSTAVSDIFVNLNLGGWAIAILSLIVGTFGVANIMFVSVRERTSQIGLKKAIGAKGSVILTEFLLESAFLCVIGGLIGLTLVFALTQVLTQVLNFPVFISFGNMMLAILLCVVVGILAGYIPARQAARLDPVVAIRSK